MSSSGLVTRVRETTHPVVFPVSAILILLFVVLAAVFPDGANEALGEVRGWITEYFGWFMIATVAFLLGLAVFLAIHPWGRIKLGPDDSTPDYGTVTWFAMLFAAGMGIGLVFWGVAEPMWFFSDPPRADAESLAGANEAMNFAFHHWGFSPWAVYAIIGLGLGYFGYRRGLPMSMRSLFHPLLGDRVHGPIGHAIDILAVVATMFGIATSLGLGASQVASGLTRVFDWEIGNGGLVLIIAAITAIATISVVSGLDRGIKRLSQFNIGVAALMAAVVFLLGPTLVLLYAYVENTGAYIQNIFDTLMFTGTYAGEEAAGFLDAWTIFYWAWWISWSPFVGMFIARVSRGRTIREFVLGVLLAPTLVSFAWFTIFGNTAINLELDAGGQAGVMEESLADESVAMFALFENMDMAGWLVTLLSLATILVVVVFFVTSSDSGSFVIDMLSSGGDLNPAVETRVFWAVSEGAVAAALLLAGGDQALTALQAGSVSTGFPFAIVLLLASWSLIRGLSQETRGVAQRRPGEFPPPATVPAAVQHEMELRERELAAKERELDIREEEIENNGGDTP